MAEKKKFQAIKGTRDLLPPETELWNRVEQTAREVFGTFGFGEIRPPIFESPELFARGIGADTDVVGKEMYTFEDRSQSLPIFGNNIEISDYVRAIETAFHMHEIENTPEIQKSVDVLKEKLRAVEAAAKDIKTNIDQYKATLWEFACFVRDDIQLGQIISLRPEATASVCRAYIEHGMHALPQPVKLYYTGPMFRRW